MRLTTPRSSTSTTSARPATCRPKTSSASATATGAARPTARATRSRRRAPTTAPRRPGPDRRARRRARRALGDAPRARVPGRAATRAGSRDRYRRGPRALARTLVAEGHPAVSSAPAPRGDDELEPPHGGTARSAVAAVRLPSGGRAALAWHRVRGALLTRRCPARRGPAGRSLWRELPSARSGSMTRRSRTARVRARALELSVAGAAPGAARSTSRSARSSSSAGQAGAHVAASVLVAVRARPHARRMSPA